MTDRIETLLRDVLAEDASAAPETAARLAGGARRRLRRRRATTAGATLALVAAVAAAATLVLPGDDRATVTHTGDLPLVGTTWQVVEYVRDGLRVEVLGEADAWLSLSPDSYAASVCNDHGGAARVAGDRLTLRAGFNTEKACPAPLTDAEDAFTALMGRELTWDVDGETLRVSAGGDVFLFRVRPTIYDDPYAATVAEGTYEGWQYRVASTGGGRLSIEARPGPGSGWATSGMADEPAHPMAWALRQPLGRDGAQLVAGFATAATVRATHETPDGAVTTLALVDAGGRKAFHGIVPRNPQHSRFRLWAADGTMIAEFVENREG